MTSAWKDEICAWKCWREEKEREPKVEVPGLCQGFVKDEFLGQDR